MQRLNHHLKKLINRLSKTTNNVKEEIAKLELAQENDNGED